MTGANQSTCGVASVEACSLAIQKGVEGKAPADYARALKGFIADMAINCNPEANPGGFRQCQAAAERAIVPLLGVAKLAEKIDLRIAAFEALARICYGNAEMAGLVVTKDHLFEHAVTRVLRPIVQVQQQEESLYALLLMQVVAALVPEAPAVGTLLRPIVAFVSDQDAEHPLFEPVKATAVEVLVSCSYTRHRREQIAALLDERAVKALLAAALESPGRALFAVQVLFANLCDLAMPLPVGNDLQEIPGVIQPPQLFGDVARQLWENTGFVADLGACLTAALAGEQWPPQGGMRHLPWKLSSTCMQLSLAGHAVPVSPLIATIERRQSLDTVGADDARAARLAAVALRGQTGCQETRLQMQESSLLVDALRHVAAEEPAAQELLQMLSDGNEATSAEPMVDVACPGSEVVVAKPW
eukprot:gnl/TRDRNA2_/TRDRNA2_188375_c0_seq1.p1 gnl/TRDRNA2_/TRDRNA2_188375_c0~~gnl/TRDRNA2_/TRDRNA2_188375_c0_seq1.p1  ORF type:complete len:416 (+),score=84.77 gnl/TRDRNA2_/TRDRNA2_188375_c0_seq1:57-1304(+)